MQTRRERVVAGRGSLRSNFSYARSFGAVKMPLEVASYMCEKTRRNKYTSSESGFDRKAYI